MGVDTVVRSWEGTSDWTPMEKQGIPHDRPCGTVHHHVHGQTGSVWLSLCKLSFKNLDAVVPASEVQVLLKLGWPVKMKSAS